MSIATVFSRYASKNIHSIQNDKIYLLSGLLPLNSSSRLSLQSTYCRSITTTSVAALWLTPSLYAEPLKRRTKIDPAVVKAREDRRRKKLEKQIRRLEKNARQLKPIDELEVPMSLIDEVE